MQLQVAKLVLSTPANRAISLDWPANVERGVKFASSSLPLCVHQGPVSFSAASYRNEKNILQRVQYKVDTA